MQTLIVVGLLQLFHTIFLHLYVYVCVRSSLCLTLLIPRKNGPGHNIDVYLQPLVAELKEFWSTKVITYDSYS